MWIRLDRSDGVGKKSDALYMVLDGGVNNEVAHRMLRRQTGVATSGCDFHTYVHVSLFRQHRKSNVKSISKVTNSACLGLWTRFDVRWL